MWIIPKTLSAFVPDTEGLNWESSELAWMCAQSLMWRSKPSAAPTWERRLKKDSWMTRLSTRILKPSQQKYFEEKFTDSLEDIHVSPSVARGSEKEKKTQGTYGHTSENMYGQLDLFGASLKMSEATPRWGYGESCPIWKRMVTERSGDCSARRKQARLTNASECSSWPTPRAGNPGSRKPGTGGKILAEEAKKNWATPVVGDSVNAKQGDCTNRKRNLGQTLCDQISGPPAQEKSSTSGKNHGSPKLNPNWVEQLMGLPIGWTDLGSWATESSHKQQN